MGKWTLYLIVFLGIWGSATQLKAEMKEVGNDELKNVTAQDGISISLDHATFYDEYGRISIFDSDNAGSLALEDVVIGNGNGWGYSFTTAEPLTIDLIEYDAPYINQLSPDSLIYGEKNVVLSINAPAWEQDLYYTANRFSFCGQELGSLKLGSINLRSFNFMLTTPDHESYGYTEGESGIYYRSLFQQTIDTFQFTYNPSPQGSLSFSGIRFANSFSNDIATNPTVATTDTDAQGSFIIGKAETPNAYEDFAHIHLTRNGTSAIIDTTLPMEGSIRINGVQLGEQAMGPVAIDGIHVHKMSMQLIP